METEAQRRLLLDLFPVFKDLAPERLERLRAGSQCVSVPAGTVLFDARQPCRGFPLLLEGAVRVFKSSPDGREIELYRVEPGDGCVLSGGCLLGQVEYAATAIAETAVVLLNVAPEIFHELMLEHEPFRRFVFRLYSERLSEVMELVEQVVFRKLDQRLATLLVRRGPAIHETHQKIADELGSVREVVSRLLRSFESRGWVVLERERISVLDPKALAELARG
jgi:CRP/FNR family transcriptional regulator, anaerobic regulatory protein